MHYKWICLYSYMYRYSIRFLCFIFYFWNSISAKRDFTFTSRFTLILILIFISMSMRYNPNVMEPCWVQQISLSNSREKCLYHSARFPTHTWFTFSLFDNCHGLSLSHTGVWMENHGITWLTHHHLPWENIHRVI